MAYKNYVVTFETVSHHEVVVRARTRNEAEEKGIKQFDAGEANYIDDTYSEVKSVELQK